MRRNIPVLIAVCGFDIYTLGFALSTLYEQAQQHLAMQSQMLTDVVTFGRPDPFRGLYPPAAVLGAIGIILLALAALTLAFSFLSACIGVHRRPI